MSISIGTRNLKFMQRGTQLPAASPPPPPPPQQPLNASSSNDGSRGGTKPALASTHKVPLQEQNVEEEEEEWILPSRSSRGSVHVSHKAQAPAGTASGGRTRVVRQDSSYLSFINGTGAEGSKSGGSSDDESASDERQVRGAAEQPKNGRMTFGSLPTAQRLDTSIVDEREEMKHLKAQETSSTRFKVFANAEDESSGNIEKGDKRKIKEQDHSSRARKGKERQDPASSTTTATPSKNPTATTRKGFLKPVLGEQRHQHPTPTTATPNQNQGQSSSNRRKKRKSGDVDSLDMQESEVLVAGARAKRGKKAPKKTARSGDGEVDMDDLAARVAAGGDEDVERYLQSVIHEMEE